jgi:hypothetical protein
LTNGTRRRRTDGRVAFENLPNILQPAFFIIEILNDEQKAVEGVTFNVTVDNGNTMTKQTDKEGVLKVPKPKSEIELSLAE